MDNCYHVEQQLGSYPSGRVGLAATFQAGRSSASEITIFDSTGMALQDVVVAATVYEKSLRHQLGHTFNLGGQTVLANRANGTRR